MASPFGADRHQPPEEPDSKDTVSSASHSGVESHFGYAYRHFAAPDVVAVATAKDPALAAVAAQTLTAKHSSTPCMVGVCLFMRCV